MLASFKSNVVWSLLLVIDMTAGFEKAEEAVIENDGFRAADFGMLAPKACLNPAGERSPLQSVGVGWLSNILWVVNVVEVIEYSRRIITIKSNWKRC